MLDTIIQHKEYVENFSEKKKTKLVSKAYDIAYNKNIFELVTRYSFRDVVNVILFLGSKFKGQNGSHSTYKIGNCRMQIWPLHVSGKGVTNKMGKSAMECAQIIISEGVRIYKLVNKKELNYKKKKNFKH